MKNLINVLYGRKGTIKVFDNGTALVIQSTQPDKIIQAREIPTYVVDLAIHSSNNGTIQIGAWHSSDDGSN